MKLSFLLLAAALLASAANVKGVKSKIDQEQAPPTLDEEEVTLGPDPTMVDSGVKEPELPKDGETVEMFHDDNAPDPDFEDSAKEVDDDHHVFGDDHDDDGDDHDDDGDHNDEDHEGPQTDAEIPETTLPGMEHLRNASHDEGAPEGPAPNMTHHNLVEGDESPPVAESSAEAAKHYALMEKMSQIQEGSQESNVQHETSLAYLDGKVGERLKDIFDKYFSADFRKGSKVLDLGVGNSYLAEDLWKDGFKHIDSIDNDEQSIKEIKQHFDPLKLTGISNIVADMTKHGAKGEYDLVIDKGAIESEDNMFSQMLPHIWRILKDDGFFISVGPYSPPDHKSREEPDNVYVHDDLMAPSEWSGKFKHIGDSYWELVGSETIPNPKTWVDHPPEVHVFVLKRLPWKTWKSEL